MTQIGNIHTPLVFAGTRFSRPSVGPISFEDKVIRLDGKDVQTYRLNPANSIKVSDLSAEDVKSFTPTKILDGKVPEPSSAKQTIFSKAQMADFATIRTIKGSISVSNAGYVSASFDIGGGQWYQDGLDSLNGPARANEIANRLAARFGGAVHTAPTALTQQLYDALHKANATSAANPSEYDTARPIRFSS